MRRRIFLSASLSFLALFFFASCEKETIKPIVVNVASATFTADVWPSFSSCAGCHSGRKIFDASTRDKAWTSLTTKGLVTLPSSGSILMTHINAAHQSTASYSAEQKAKIVKWIDDGAKNN